LGTHKAPVLFVETEHEQQPQFAFILMTGFEEEKKTQQQKQTVAVRRDKANCIYITINDECKFQ
jgi:hypothetical protein